MIPCLGLAAVHAAMALIFFSTDKPLSRTNQIITAVYTAAALIVVELKR